MTRIFVSLGGLGLLVGVLFLPALTFDDVGAHDEADPAVSEPTTNTSYVADFTVHEDGAVCLVAFGISMWVPGLHKPGDRIAGSEWSLGQGVHSDPDR